MAGPFCRFQSGLRLGGSAHGAGLGAGAAVDALVGVDFVLAVALGDRFNGAFAGAGAAGDARICNFVSHDGSSFIVTLIACCHYHTISGPKKQ